MSDSVPKPISETDLEALAKAARLEIAPDRRAAVAPTFEGMLQIFDALDAVDLGETPPTNSFDARWRDLP